MDDERTTKEVIELLGQDCERCHEALIAAIDAGETDGDGSVDADYEFYARQFIRAVFAYIEATTFSVKASSAWRCMEKDIGISPQERYFATDTEYELNDRGEVVEALAKISLARNIRFALALNRKAHKVAEPFDPSVEWWSCLKEAIRVRDRLTHPKWPRDLDVSGDEVVKVLKALRGFEQELLRHDEPNAA
ncbi:MAG: hypothetical protein ABTQ26_04055 [Azonexus sp.]